MGALSLLLGFALMRSFVALAGYHLGKKALPLVTGQLGGLVDRHAPKLAKTLGRKPPMSDFERLLHGRLGKRDNAVSRLIRSLPQSDWKLALRQWGVASAAHHLVRPRLGFLGSLGTTALDAWIIEQRFGAVKTFGGWVARRSALHAGKKATAGFRSRVAEIIRPAAV
jgi:hypothetical protein